MKESLERSPEASNHGEIWALGFAGPYDLHYFIWGLPSSLTLQVYKKYSCRERSSSVFVISTLFDYFAFA
ncbi:hypothetical protein CFP56_012623 [Quercus suber]|uniref:Uncharacterized protein n=1 Tax=Quercus suber TaxID=58331 RepID=A0AAW0KVA9_QUESU